MAAAENDWKKRLGVVYSTDPGYNYDKEEKEEEESLSPEKQDLKVRLEKKGRKGKTVSIVSGFKGNSEDLEALGKELKKKLGTGGSVVEGEILIQGDFRQRIKDYLSSQGYKIRGG
jgi:translation initiation factor 1